MVMETRGGAQIGVLNENVQGIQQQLDEHSNQFGLINVKLDRMESNFGEFKATLSGFQSTLSGFQSTFSGFQSMMEERLPKPAEPNVNQASSSIRVQPSFGEQLPTTPLSTHRLPIGAEERNGMPMRPPNQDIRLQPNQTRVGVQMGEGLHHLLKANMGCMVKNIGMRKGFLRQQSQGQQAQPQRRASQAREPRNAPWPQGDVVEPWYDHGGGKGNWGRARNYQGPQDRDPYGKNQDPLQRQQGRQAREPRAMELEFPRFKGGDPTSWMFRAIQYFEYYQVHDASKVMHASYHLDDDALIWFQSCEHDLGCWDNFARAIQLRFGPPSYDDPMELLIKLKHVNSIEEYKGLFESLSNRIRNLSSMHKLSCFMSGLKDEVRLAIKMQGPRTLGEAYALAKIQEQYLANVKGSTRPSYEANKDNWEQYSSQEVAAQFVPKVATQFDPKVATQLDPKVAVQFDPKVAAQLNPKLTPKQMLERRRKGLCYNCDESWTMWHTCKAMKLYLIEEVQEEEGAYVTSDEEEERVEWCEERRNTKEESINKDIQVPSRYWLIGRSPLMKKHLTKKQLEDSSSIRPQQDHNLEDKVFRWEGQC
uniref:Ty3 transposon capsid-like protein domain-containing protein n=1 Tax=Fagus sylvatica TaxID=28930 RepID=A0A2N9GY46_FAGSY